MSRIALVLNTDDSTGKQTFEAYWTPDSGDTARVESHGRMQDAIRALYKTDGSAINAPIAELLRELADCYGYEPAPARVQGLSGTQQAIADECDALRDLLLAKNAAYGDSISDPVRVFSRVDNIEAIKIRCDDKLARLARGHAMPDESRIDTITDLCGYLVLLLIELKRGGE